MLFKTFEKSTQLRCWCLWLFGRLAGEGGEMQDIRKRCNQCGGGGEAQGEAREEAQGGGQGEVEGGA